jgi:hypothetical protein
MLARIAAALVCPVGRTVFAEGSQTHASRSVAIDLPGTTSVSLLIVCAFWMAGSLNPGWPVWARCSRLPMTDP